APVTASGADPFPRASECSSTSATGFRAGAGAAGIKASGRPDLGIWASDVECVAVGTFTQNSSPAAPAVLSRERLNANPRAQAVVFNAGNANACNGERGLDDVRELAKLAAEHIAIDQQLVLAAETGIIGV